MAKNVRVEVNHKSVARLERNAAKALEMAADATLTEIITAEVIPFDVGTMQNDQTFLDTSEKENGVVSIITSARQATRLYFHPEYNFQTVNNAFAGAGWFNPWISGMYRDFPLDTYAKLLRRLNGGE